MKERLDRKQRELVMLEEVEEEDLVPAKAPPNLDAAFRFNPGQDNISHIKEWCHSDGAPEQRGRKSLETADLQKNPRTGQWPS